VRLAIPTETIAHAAAQLLPLAPDVVVVEPVALVKAIGARLRAIARSYAAAKARPRRKKGAP
jgi:hypothetical protein